MKNISGDSNFALWRLNIIYLLIGVIFTFYAIRLFNVQIVRGVDYYTRAEDNRRNTISVQTQRGIIYDRNGYVLARNISSYDVTITPAYLPTDPGAIQEIYRQLSTIIDMPVTQGTLDDDTVRLFKPCVSDIGISQVVYIAETNAPYSPVKVKCNVEERTARIIRERAYDWPGVGIEIEPVREYPTGNLTSEIIGFLGPIPAIREKELRDLGFLPNRDKVGYAGVEDFLDDLLRGKNGERLVEVDAAGKVIRDLIPPKDPEPGANIRLTIDTRLQAAARQAMIRYFNYWNDKSADLGLSNGSVIAVNPKTGEILALVSLPNYENNRFARIIPSYYYEQLTADPQTPLLNHGVSAEYAPGSVFKMATAIGALNENIVSLNTVLNDPGKITILQKYSPNDPGTFRDYVCWDRAGHGAVNFYRGVAMSCDVYFYKVGGGYQNEVRNGLGIWYIGEYARAIGYGAATGIELNGEASGLMPDPNWKRVTVGENWSTGDTYITSFGQGYVLATPLQVLMSVATLANNGKLMKPTLVRELVDLEGKVYQAFSPKMIRDITTEPFIRVYDQNNFLTGEKRIVQPWVVKAAKEGMRLVVTEGTAAEAFTGDDAIMSAGKTGTAEYCDDVAQARNRCQPGNWPAHAWYVGYAPYDDPEIAVIAFAYNGTEGSKVSAPIVRLVLDAYFELKAIDRASGASTP